METSSPLTETPRPNRYLKLLSSPAELLVDDLPHPFTNRKHLALLAYLVMEPGEHKREQLTRFVWSSGASGSIDTAFSELRAALGPEVVPPRARKIALEPGTVDTDALRLLAGLGHPRLRARAIELYQAPFLEDFNGRGSAESFIRWVERTRRRLDEAFRQLCGLECEEAASRGDWSRVLAVAEHGVRKSPGWADGEAWRDAANQALHARPVGDRDVAEIPVAEREDGEDGGLAEVAARGAIVPAVRPSRRGGRRLGGVAIALLAAVTVLIATHDREPDPCTAPDATAKLADENYLDNTRLPRDTPFVKMWRLRNTGSCAWTNAFSLRYVSSSHPGELLSVSQAPIPVERPVPPNSTYTFTVPMRAPETPGTYMETWRLADDRSSTVKIHRSDGVWVKIVVP